MVIPAVDILDGKCVQLIGGDPEKKRIVLDNPVRVARGWMDKGAKLIHVIDLNGAFNKGNNLQLVARMASDFPIQAGGGIRDNIAILTVMAIRVKRGILGTKAIMDTDWLDRVVRTYPGKIVVAIDAKGKDIVIKGWQEESGQNIIEYAKSIDELDLAGLLYTNVDVEGRLAGTDLGPIRELVETCKTPIMASGGVTTMEDLRALADVGVEGAVVGTAIYTGDIDFKEALEEFR